MMVLDLNLSRMHERPTSLPAPKGMISSISPSSVTYSSLRLLEFEVEVEVEAMLVVE